MNLYTDFELSRIRKIGGMHLRELVGSSVVKAVDSVYESTDVESVLAELVLLKFGKTLLKNKELRHLLIDSASGADIQTLTIMISFSPDSDLRLRREARDYFSTLTTHKARLFLDWLQFSDVYLPIEILDTRESVELVQCAFGDEVKLKGYLHPYQKDMKDQILSSIGDLGSRVMCQMPTGAGKTFTALETFVDMLRNPFQQKFFVWLVNTNELAEQALTSFRYLWQVKGDRGINTFRLFKDFFSDYRKFSEGGVVFASYDLFYSILANNDDARRSSLLHLINNTEYLIVDEAHAAVADTYSECVGAFLADDITKVLGLSATPTRISPVEQEELSRLFSNRLLLLRDSYQKVVDDPIRYLQKESYLANIKTEILESGYSSSEQDEKKLLKALAESAERNRLILESIESAVRLGEKTLVFACSLDHVLALFILCQKKGIRSQFIIGNTPQSSRQKILDAFNNGDFDILINLDILSTGIDLPNVNRLIITRPINSPILYSQIVGRALRGPKNGGNPINTIVNILDNTFNHGTISTLYTGFQEAWSS